MYFLSSDVDLCFSYLVLGDVASQMGDNKTYKGVLLKQKKKKFLNTNGDDITCHITKKPGNHPSPTWSQLHVWLFLINIDLWSDFQSYSDERLFNLLALWWKKI